MLGDWKEVTPFEEECMITTSEIPRAFKGRLVSQDPTDEPASMLLARLGAARNDKSARDDSIRRRR
jgi:hypothetical protein